MMLHKVLSKERINAEWNRRTYLIETFECDIPEERDTKKLLTQHQHG